MADPFLRARANLLLVDDNDINRGAFKMALERQGFSVTAAVNGTEALQTLAGKTFDLVLLDIQMPDLSGYEVLQEIRKTKAAEDMPVIMVTARDRSEDIVRALESGANDYVTKPIDLPVALARIRTQLLHRQAVASLRESEARLRQLDEMRNDFISMVTHELNTPISIIDGAIDFFKDRFYGPLNDNYGNYVDIISQNVKRLSRLAGDLLDISKLEAGRFSIEPKRVDLRKIARNACVSLKPMADSRGILIVPPDETPELVAEVDAVRLEQVVSNIVRNALKFAQTRVVVRMDREDQTILLVVEDDGPGIESEDLPSLFQKFYQGKAGKKAGGSGLGLAIVKGIIEAHGGTVRAENRDGGCGARFAVSLPIPV